MPLTPEEQQEMMQLEAELGVSERLTPAEQAELAQLEAEFGGDKAHEVRSPQDIGNVPETSFGQALGAFAARAPFDAPRVAAEGLGQMIAHPIQTAEALGSAVQGAAIKPQLMAARKLFGDKVVDMSGEGPMGEVAMQGVRTFDAILDDYASKYGTWERFKNALENRSGEVVLDLLDAAAVGGVPITKAGIISKLSGLEKTGRVMTGIGRYADPAALPMEGLSKAGSVVRKGLEKRRVAPGAAMYERAYGKIPERDVQIADRLEAEYGPGGVPSPAQISGGESLSQQRRLSTEPALRERAQAQNELTQKVAVDDLLADLQPRGTVENRLRDAGEIVTTQIDNRKKSLRKIGDKMFKRAGDYLKKSGGTVDVSSVVDRLKSQRENWPIGSPEREMYNHWVDKLTPKQMVHTQPIVDMLEGLKTKHEPGTAEFKALNKISKMLDRKPSIDLDGLMAKLSDASKGTDALGEGTTALVQEAIEAGQRKLETKPITIQKQRDVPQTLDDPTGKAPSYEWDDLDEILRVKYAMSDAVKGGQLITPRIKSRDLVQTIQELDQIMLDAVPDHLAKAKTTYGKLAENIKGLEAGVIGKVAGAVDKYKYDDIANIIMSDKHMNPQRIRNMREIISRQSPEAWQAVTYSYMEQLLNQKGILEGRNWAKKYNNILQDPVNQRKIIAAMGDEGRFTLEKLNEVLGYIGEARDYGSSTERNFRASQILRNVKGFFADKIFLKIDRNADRIMAEFLANPKWTKDVRKLRQIDLSKRNAWPQVLRTFMRVNNAIERGDDPRTTDVLMREGRKRASTPTAPTPYRKRG